jgi:alpha-beta hydrolase superfamily lysophospholipase
LRVYKKTFKTKPHEIKRRRFHEKRLKQLEAYENQTFFVESSKNKYNIEVRHIQSKIETNRAIILVHGIRSNYYDLLPVAFRYLNDGYHVILYNQRQSGLTGGTTSTFGLYERFDLEDVATVARRIYKEGKVGVHGFSMGAATAIMQSELNERTDLVDFYILDAPFHTMASTVELAARRGGETKMPPWYVKFAGDTVLRLRQRVAYKDIMPLNVIHHTTRPILLIHGEKDDVTCPNGSRQLFGAIHHNKRRLEIFPEEAHCTAHYRNEREYFERVHRFIADFI